LRILKEIEYKKLQEEEIKIQKREEFVNYFKVDLPVVKTN